MAVQHRVFTPEHVNVVRRACERIRSQRRFPPRGVQAERLAVKALNLFKNGYISEAALIRALREES